MWLLSRDECTTSPLSYTLVPTKMLGRSWPHATELDDWSLLYPSQQLTSRSPKGDWSWREEWDILPNKLQKHQLSPNPTAISQVSSQKVLYGYSAMLKRGQTQGMGPQQSSAWTPVIAHIRGHFLKDANSSIADNCSALWEASAEKLQGF